MIEMGERTRNPDLVGFPQLFFREFQYAYGGD